MHQEDATITDHRPLSGGYRILTLASGAVAPEVKPGQFVHLLVPGMGQRVLRRPFSVYRAEGDRLSLLYKDVGQGTHTMTALEAGQTVNLIGPLGTGYPDPDPACDPVLVAGGYGMAALYLTAARSGRRGIAFFGGASAGDILCVEAFEACGWEVRVTTEDGSLGMRGRVTEALDAWLGEHASDRPREFFVCGPNAMLRAVSARAEANPRDKAWISMDRHMGCGVGACLTCVQKVRAEDGGWQWARVCREGPVFAGRAIVWDEEA
jgi:dihydroorotate dehydrogenase electron transfer subunit